jgi:hypothetical protein
LAFRFASRLALSLHHSHRVWYLALLISIPQERHSLGADCRVHSLHTSLSPRSRRIPHDEHCLTFGRSHSPHDKNHEASVLAMSNGRLAQFFLSLRASNAHSREQYFVAHE